MNVEFWNLVKHEALPSWIFRNLEKHEVEASSRTRQDPMKEHACIVEINKIFGGRGGVRDVGKCLGRWRRM